MKENLSRFHENKIICHSVTCLNYQEFLKRGRNLSNKLLVQECHRPKLRVLKPVSTALYSILTIIELEH